MNKLKELSLRLHAVSVMRDLLEDKVIKAHLTHRQKNLHENEVHALPVPPSSLLTELLPEISRI